MLKALYRTAAVATLAAMVPAAASALPAKFTYLSEAAGSFINVNTNRSEAGGPNKGVLAGPFNMQQTDPASPLGKFVAWCFEIDQDLIMNSTGTRTYNFGGSLTTAQRDRVQTVFDANYHDSTIAKVQPKAAAFQLALWEVIYDTNFSLANGAFKSNVGGDLRTMANGFLSAANLYDKSKGKKWVITELHSATVQDIGTVTAIPLPAAVWLLLGVSGALVVAKRRSAGKAA